MDWLDREGGRSLFNKVELLMRRLIKFNKLRFFSEEVFLNLVLL